MEITTAPQRPSFGIPYASKRQDSAGRWYCDCPVCGKRIALKKRKDFESMSGAEYAAHYAAEHGGRGKSCDKCDLNLLDGGHYAENCPNRPAK